MFGLGITELLILLVIIILLFGAKKIPNLMKGIGKGIKDYEDARREGSGPENTVK